MDDGYGVVFGNEVVHTTLAVSGKVEIREDIVTKALVASDIRALTYRKR